MSGLLVAIVGSADANRTYVPEVRDPDAAREFAEKLGAVLAARGCRLLVYDKNYIEGDVVRGYVESGKAEPGSIVVYCRVKQDADQFHERKNHKELFAVERFTEPLWEVFFYRSLQEAQAIVLIGGGPSTLAAGMTGLVRKLPILPVLDFGGAAETVCYAFENLCGLPDDAKKRAKAAFVEGRALERCDELVQAIFDQEAAWRQREIDRENERARAAAWQNEQLRQKEAAALADQTRKRLCLQVAFALLVACVLATSAAFAFLPSVGRWTPALLLLLPALAGASGGTLRLLWADQSTATLWRPATLGLAGGFSAGLLYAVSQLVGNATITNVLVALAAMTGFFGGFSFDTLFLRWSKPDAAPTTEIPKIDKPV